MAGLTTSHKKNMAVSSFKNKTSCSCLVCLECKYLQSQSTLVMTVHAESEQENNLELCTNEKF